MDIPVVGDNPDRSFQLLGYPVCRVALQIAQMAVEGGSRDEDELRVRVFPQGSIPALTKSSTIRSPAAMILPP